MGVWVCGKGWRHLEKIFPLNGTNWKTCVLGRLQGQRPLGPSVGGEGQDRTRPRHRRSGLSAGGREVGRELGAGQGTTLTEDAESGDQRGGQGRVV